MAISDNNRPVVYDCECFYLFSYDISTNLL